MRGTRVVKITISKTKSKKVLLSAKKCKCLSLAYAAMNMVGRWLDVENMHDVKMYMS